MKYLVADLFCGAGGSSTGAERAVRELGGEMVLVAVNHWPLAIETHQLNHPTARHYVEDVSAVDPERLVPEGRLDLLMASPECRYFSRARGGKPINDQARMNPWAVQNWLTRLDVRCLLVENVPEFVEWGPLLDNNRPDPARKGLYFEAWLRALWELGYHAEWRYLNAADYGDATTRTRFFLQARKDGRQIRWPTPTHSPIGTADLFGNRPKWRAAREIIDWEKPGRSLLDDPRYKRRPLSEKTRRRIARGLEKFGGPLAPLYIRLLNLDTPLAEGEGESAGPFIMGKQSSPSYRDVDQPLPTITTQATPMLIEPTAALLVGANRNNNVPKPTHQPVPTITSATGGGIYVVETVAEPFVLGQQSGATPRGTDEPIPTVAAAGAISLVRPVITSYYGTLNTSPVDKPVPTAKPFLVPNFGERDGQQPRTHDVDEPLPAVTGHGAGALVEPVIVQTDQTGGNGSYTRSVDSPLATVVTKQNCALVEPVIQAIEAGEIDPHRLVIINGVPHLLDIRFRMLSNKELARAMGFDDEESEYEFAGNVGQVTKQIGNAVPVGTAAALVKAILGTPEVTKVAMEEVSANAAD